MATCGLLVAFGRIVQYQSFAMMFVLLAAWAALEFAESGAPARLYAAATAFSLGVLFHYDVLTAGPLLGFLVVAGCWRHRSRVRGLGLHLAGAAGLAIVLVGAFYVPYALQPGFSQVREYLMYRVSSGQGMGTFPRTQELLALYLPPGYLPILAVFLLVGLVSLVRRKEVASMALVFWFVSVFVFYMLLGGDPRSHVYNIFLPGMIIAGYGMWRTVELIRSAGARRMALAALWVIVGVWGSFVWMMFVDHTVEHPWFRKTVLGYTLPNLVDRQIEGVFGFPYDRGLGQVGQLFDEGTLAGTFDSNERREMADFYFHSRRGESPTYYIYVHQPLSLERDLPTNVRDGYRPVRELSVDGRKTIDIYQAIR
jgi:hypothetical protein